MYFMKVWKEEKKKVRKKLLFPAWKYFSNFYVFLVTVMTSVFRLIRLLKLLLFIPRKIYQKLMATSVHLGLWKVG